MHPLEKHSRQRCASTVKFFLSELGRRIPQDSQGFNEPSRRPCKTRLPPTHPTIMSQHEEFLNNSPTRLDTSFGESENQTVRQEAERVGDGTNQPSPSLVPPPEGHRKSRSCDRQIHILQSKNNPGFAELDEQFTGTR